VDPLDPNSMPSGLAAMHDDPYRTLSRWVRDADGYISSTLPSRSATIKTARGARPICVRRKTGSAG
jgi:hypothetical protein